MSNEEYYARTIAEALPWVRHTEWPIKPQRFDSYFEKYGIIYLPHPHPEENPRYGIHWPTVNGVDIPVIIASPKPIDGEAISFLVSKIDWGKSSIQSLREILRIDEKI